MREPDNFRKALASDRLLFLDGGMGTMLQAAGMPPGSPPELFCLENAGILMKIQGDYVSAGADILTTCTFGANRFKLPADQNVYKVNKELAQLAREAIKRRHPEREVFVAGDIGPSGHFARPLGDVEPEALIAAFAEQARGLLAGDVDLFFIETQFDLAEARAAVIACREVSDLPIMVSMTFEDGVSLTGSTPEIFTESMLNMGVDVIGTNCSLGPREMAATVKQIVACGAPHVLAEPNAGLPELRDGQTIFPLEADAFAELTSEFVSLGVQILGGCCGTGPEHIRELRKRAEKIKRPEITIKQASGIILSSRSSLVRIGPGNPLVLIGERINPTGKKALTEELQAGNFKLALQFADAQLESGASVLDVNVGAPLVDESRLLPELAALLTARTGAPLSLDSPNSHAIAKSLPWCPGSTLVNSINGEEERLEFLAPLCRRYGAPFILLPLQGASLPESAKERIQICEKILKRAEELAVPKRLILIDILALSVSSVKDAAKECIEMLHWCAQEGFASTLGLSNISFGLPARALLNTVFLAMARGSGLNSCIANPSAPRVRECLDAINALEGHDQDALNFIAGYAQWKADCGSARLASSAVKSHNLYDVVLNGDRESLIEKLEAKLATGADPFNIVNEILIPAINEVGARFERREYFLPQLIRSAETVQLAFKRLRPLLEAKGGPEKRPVIVMATVEGDIHDIGKNIVSLLLGNHGFEVIDAGKDVPATEIVACAEKNGAEIIGLSALMTTTMTRMEDTIKLLREKNSPIKVMVGGAAVTQAFADAIGADAYCADAVSSVRAAKAFLEKLS